MAQAYQRSPSRKANPVPDTNGAATAPDADGGLRPNPALVRILAGMVNRRLREAGNTNASAVESTGAKAL